jgi:Ala-tRNA(Pro) deacylase
MGMAQRVRHFLDDHEVEYDLVRHPPGSDSMHIAEAAHISGDQLAKSVVLGDELGYVVAVMPASHRLDIGWLHRCLNRNLGLVTVDDLPALFSDCEPGTVPPIGEAYGLDMLLDDSLVEQPDVYFESGDDCELVHVSGEAFDELMGHALHGHFSHHL